MQATNSKDQLAIEDIGRYEMDNTLITVHDNNSAFEYVPFLTGIAYCNTLLGRSPEEDDYIEIALNALEKIGNVHTAMYVFLGTTDSKGELCLPYKAQTIEYVSSGFPDRVTMSFKSDISQLYAPGRYVAYKFLGDKIQTNFPFTKLSIMYNSIRLDEDGYPAITKTEAEACAYWWNYVDFQKRMWRGEQLAGNLVQPALAMANARINQARVPAKFSQNFINNIHDIVYSRDGKVYNKSLKMIKLS